VINVTCADPTAALYISYSGVFNESHVASFNNFSEISLPITESYSPRLHVTERALSGFNGSHYVIQDLDTGAIRQALLASTNPISLDALYKNSQWIFYYLDNPGTLTLTKYGPGIFSTVTLANPTGTVYVRSSAFLTIDVQGSLLNYNAVTLQQLNVISTNGNPSYMFPSMVAVADVNSNDLCLKSNYNCSIPPGKVVLYPDVGSQAVLFPSLFPMPSQFGSVVAFCSVPNTLVVASRFVKFPTPSKPVYEGVVHIFQFLNNASWGVIQTIQFPEVNQFNGVYTSVTSIACDGNTLIVSLSDLNFFMAFENSMYTKKFMKLGTSQYPYSFISVSDYCDSCYLENCVSCSWYCVNNIYFGSCQGNCPTNSKNINGNCICNDGYYDVLQNSFCTGKEKTVSN